MPEHTELQLRGLHRLFLGDRVTISTRNGLVKTEAVRYNLIRGTEVTLTPEQADEIARDLMAYAEMARREGAACGRS